MTEEEEDSEIKMPEKFHSKNMESLHSQTKNHAVLMNLQSRNDPSMKTPQRKNTLLEDISDKTEVQRYSQDNATPTRTEMQDFENN